MSEEIKNILDRLERIDHKEYGVAFEFADSATFDEMARCFGERKLFAIYIKSLQQKVEQLENENFQLKMEWALVKSALDTSEERLEQLEKEIKELKQQELCKTYDERLFSLKLRVEQLENIRKEAIESIEDCKKVNGCGGICTVDYNYLLNILNRGYNND